MDFAGRIAGLRIGAGMTQEQLAQKLYVSAALVSKWETGMSRPTYECAGRVAELFGVTVDSIIGPGAYLAGELASCLPEGDDTDGDSLADMLNAFLGTLNERDRGVFIRRYYNVDEVCAIAANYGISEAYVYTVLSRVRKKMKLYFTKSLKQRKGAVK